MSEKRNEGGSAFPVMDTLRANDINSLACIDGGMTLRDYFAGQALAGIMAFDCRWTMNADTRAELAYRIADAMLKERDKP